MAVLKVFHGSREGTGHSGASSGGLGDWFGTDNKEYAQRYGKVGCYRIELNNPYLMDVGEFRSYDRDFSKGFKSARNYRNELENKGHDGIIVTQRGGVHEYILFDKNVARHVEPEKHDD